MSLALRLEDMTKGTSVDRRYRQFLRILQNSPEQIVNLQNQKLEKLISHVYENIPWYRSEMHRLGIRPEMIRNKEDLSCFPVLSRETLQAHSLEMTWKTYKGKIFSGSSSGTTGIPIRFAKDEAGQSAGVAAGYVLMGMSGRQPGMRNVHIWGNQESVKNWRRISSRIKRKIFSRINIDSTLISNPEKLPYVVKLIADAEPFSLDGYANSIYELAHYLKRKQISIPSLRAVFTTAENLLAHQKQLIEEAIAPVSDLYGCSEINGIACKPIGEGVYYTLDPHIILEASPVDKTSLHEVLVTDLDNHFMPLIRYRIGDLVDAIMPPSSEKRFPLSYFKQLYGRTSDFVMLPSGKKLFPVTIFGGTLYRQFPEITKHKVIWDGKKLQLIFEAKEKLDVNLLNERVARSLKEFHVEHETVITEKMLPDQKGKFRYFQKVSDAMQNQEKNGQ